MSDSAVVQTRNLPKKWKTLRYKIADWATEVSMSRLHGGEFVETSTVAFVRHHYTNYEELLETGADYLPTKQAATQLATDILNAAYGSQWQ